MSTLPRATVRLQLRNGVDFDRLCDTLDYHAALGISHLYLSPILQAHEGSSHGYDTIDYRRVDPALGGEAGLRRLATAAHARGMGLIVDFVPNHMAAAQDNAWWRDVQRWGRDSQHAENFDICHLTACGQERPLLLPVLDRDHAVALAQQRFQLIWHHDEPYVDCEGQHYPLAPASLPALLRQCALEDAAGQVHQALRSHVAGSEAARAAVREALRAPGVQQSVSAHWQRWARHDQARLDHVLETQPWRLADWRCANDALNWRRFFNINGLAGLRIEHAPTHKAVHATIERLLGEGVIDGLRIDHVDGLADPGAYCRRLRKELDGSAEVGAHWLVVEKILAADEDLPSTWPVHGTTGYDFMDQVSAVLHAAEGVTVLTRAYQRLCADHESFQQHRQRARHEVLHGLLACDLDMCCQQFHALARHSDAHRDMSHASLRRALAALAENHGVYRSYRADGCTGTLESALAAAHDALPRADHAALHWLASTMRAEPATATVRAAVARFEQLTAPVAAKAIEDTAFYRYPRLLSRNEVGGHPETIGIGVGDFHRACIHRQQRWPAAMLCTASHDHKLGEDTRMRVATLSECPQRWANRSRHWIARWADGNRAGPDRRDLYMLLQMLVGIWPPGVGPGTPQPMRGLARRMRQWLTKALRESGRHSSWACHDEGYEAAAAGCLETMFADRVFLAEVHRFVRSLAPASALSSLAQLTLRCTTPGIPDLYQGREYWDFSMVDPDNRRAVDFAAHAARFAPDAPIAALLRTWQDGRIKQTWLACLLRARRQRPDLFSHGTYVPLPVHGAQAAHVIAFARCHRDQWLLVVVPRCPLRLLGRCSRPLIAAGRWQDTTIPLPAAVAGQHFHALASGCRTSTNEGKLTLSRLLATVPVEVLVPAAPAVGA